MSDEYVKTARAYYFFDLGIRRLHEMSEMMSDIGIEESDAFRSLLGEFYTKGDEMARKSRSLARMGK